MSRTERFSDTERESPIPGAFHNGLAPGAAIGAANAIIDMNPAAAMHYHVAGNAPLGSSPSEA